MRPKVITICGSLKFKKEMLLIARKLTIARNIVITPIFPIDENVKIKKTEKEIFDEMHKEKIKMSDTIFVVNVNGYIGNSTKKEIEFAKTLNKEILYLEKI